MKIVIIGGELAGFAATYKLCGSHEVVIVEKDSEIGGMAACPRPDPLKPGHRW